MFHCRFDYLVETLRIEVQQCNTYQSEALDETNAMT